VLNDINNQLDQQASESASGQKKIFFSIQLAPGIDLNHFNSKGHSFLSSE